VLTPAEMVAGILKDLRIKDGATIATSTGAATTPASVTQNRTRPSVPATAPANSRASGSLCCSR